jgi:intracellular septation protein
MQMLIDFLPIIVFFAGYFTLGIYWATGALIVVLVGQIAITYALKRPVPKMLLVSGGLAVVLGGITLVLQNPIFIQLKLTMVDALFALAFLGSQFIGKKTFTERMLGEIAEASPQTWRALNLIWVGTFAVLSAGNVYVVYSFSMDTWVYFKTFGTMALTLVVLIAEVAWLVMHAPPEQNPEEGQ